MHTFWYWYGAGGAVTLLLSFCGLVISKERGAILFSKSGAAFVLQAWTMFTSIVAKSLFWPATLLVEIYFYQSSNGLDDMLEKTKIDFTEHFGMPTEPEEFGTTFNAVLMRAQKALHESPGGKVHPMIYSLVLTSLAYINVREFFIREHGKDEAYARSWFSRNARSMVDQAPPSEQIHFQEGI